MHPFSFPYSPYPTVFTSVPLLSSSRQPSALISLAPITSLLHFLLLLQILLQRLVVLVNNWFWLSQCADKDNSRAIKSSSPVLSSCFFPPSFYRHIQTHTHTHTHCLWFLTSLSLPPLFLSASSPPILLLRLTSLLPLLFLTSLPTFLFLPRSSFFLLLHPLLSWLISVLSKWHFT